MMRLTATLLFPVAIAGWVCVIPLRLSAQVAEPALHGSSDKAFHAVAGEPFGVASMAIPVGVMEAGRLPRVLVTDAGGRVFYPEIDIEELPPTPSTGLAPRRFGRGGLIDRLKNAVDNASQQVHPPSQLRVQFLFRGHQPLSVRLTGDLQQTVSITPQPFEAAQHRALMDGWWKGYTHQARQQLAAGDYLPGIETYLTSMLAARLSLPDTDLRSKKEIHQSQAQEPQSTIELLAGTDAMRKQILSEVRLGPDRANPQAKVAIPSAPIWREPVIPPVPSDLPLESIAGQVPPECFYLRFGKFSNSIWFQELTKGQGDGLAQMVMKRGLDYQANQRLERMLNTKTSALAKLFGDQLISDMAIIGTDLFVQDGPAIGMLFEATNRELLGSALSSERSATAKRLADQGVRLESLVIDDRDVSLLSAPDHSIRSFMVAHQQYIFISTSQHLVHRFLEVSRGQPSLSSQPIFRYTRSVMPIKNDYDLFAFFPPQFFRTLVSPQYQIELRRRLRAIMNLQWADMASLVAKSEGSRAESLQDLIDERFLPAWFLENVDTSQPLRGPSGWLDSRRGGRGSFLPIPDVPVEDCSPEEAQRYVQQAEFYAQSWPQTDPLVIGLRRFADQESPDVERLALEAYVAPFGKDKYGWLSMFLAPPVNTQIQLPPDDIGSIQAHLSGSSLLNLSRLPIADHVMFLGIKDMTPPPPDNDRRLLETLRALQQAPGYIGAWPHPGYLDRLPFGLGGGPPDAFGFSKLLIGAWRWTASGFSILSFDRSILENCMLYLRPIAAEDPAQVRLMIGDLENRKVSSWINTFWYRRALEASRGNALLLDSIQSQFKVSPEQAKTVAERFLDGRLVCPLGGEYQLPGAGQPTDADATRPAQAWSSTAWPSTSASDPSQDSPPPTIGLAMNPQTAFPPPEYRAPWLGWFRGLKAHLTQLPQQLILVGEVRLQKLPPPQGINDEPSGALPSMNFNLFTAPFQFFGKGDKPPADSSQDRRKF